MEDKYYLAVEVKPKSYFPIDLLDLKISKFYTTTKLEELDNFTLNFTTEEILKAIKEANVVELNDKALLVVIYYEKNDVRKMECLTKDNYYDMWALLKKGFNDKAFLNKVYNFLNKKIDDKILKDLKESEDVDSYLSVISKLSYIIQRKLYFYLYEK